MGQTLSAISWYRYGKHAFTEPGFREASASFTPLNELVSRDSMEKRIFLITGANSGLGYEMAKQLSELGAKEVVMLCRSEERGQKALEEIRKQTGKDNLTLEILDVSRPPAIKEFAKRYNESGRPIHALINNAGALFHERRDTPEGFEATFAVHTLGPYLLTEALLPSLSRAEPFGRVVTMTSGGLYTCKMDTEHFQTPVTEFTGKESLNSTGAGVYAQCKRHQLYMTQIWAEKYPIGKTNVRFHVTHPGWTRTPGTDDALPAWFARLPLRAPPAGADCALWLALADAGPPADSSGGFWFDRAPARGEFAGWGRADHASGAADVRALAAYLERCARRADGNDSDNDSESK